MSFGQAIDECIDQLAGELQRIRRHLHVHPEPSGEEFQTTLFLAERLREAGVPFRVAPTQRGLIAEAADAPPGPRVAMRGDMDALHIQDEKHAEYSSRRDGVMHACGHDAHSTIVLGATLALHRVRDRLPWPCPWRAVFQPAEETSQGAVEMINAGAVDDVSAIVALHVDPERLAGDVGLRYGPLTACCLEMEVTVHGRGGHAARPHHSQDPVAAAVHFVSDVYQLVPRAVDSQDPVVVTFGVIQGGDNANVIPERVVLKGTIRTLGRRTADDVRQVLHRIARGVGEVTATRIDLQFDAGTDAVVNDPRVTDAMREAAAEVVGPDRVQSIPRPSMGAEDFAAYLNHVPGCLLRLGVAAEGRPRHFLHSPRFDIDEKALAIGAKILARTLVLLARPQDRKAP